MRPHYLRAIEADEFDAFPSKVHARGFLRAYADYLGIDPEPLVVELENKDQTSTAAEAGETASSQLQPVLDLETYREADAIFREIGLSLRRQRELLGISIEDVERHTHLRAHYLNALETGDLEKLPSPVQGRGMLNNYAAFLGLNPDTLLLRFADGLQAQLDARRAALPAPKASPVREQPRPPGRLKHLLSPDILIGGSIAVFLGLFILWGIIRIFSITTDTEPTMTAPSIAEVLLATPTVTETPTVLPQSPTSPPQAPLFPTFPVLTGDATTGTPPASGGADVQVYLTIRQRAWMRVTVDGEIQFEGRVLSGSAYPFIGRTQVEVLTGNAAGLQVFYNGTDLGVMGEIGEVVDQVFTIQGVFTPTPTITATPSPTAPITVPPPGTPAATFTITPLP